MAKKKNNNKSKKEKEEIAEQIPLEEIIDNNKKSETEKTSKNAPEKAAQKKATSKSAETKKEDNKKETKPKAEPQKANSKKTEDKKAEAKKAETKKSETKKSNNKRVAEEKKADKKAEEPKAAEKKNTKAAEKKEPKKPATESKPAPEKKAEDTKPAEEKSTEKKPAEKKATEKKAPNKKKPAAEKPVEKKEEKAKPKGNSKGYLDFLEDKKKLLDEAFADIENQLKELNVDKDKTEKIQPKEKPKPVKEEPQKAEEKVEKAEEKKPEPKKTTSQKEKEAAVSKKAENKNESKQKDTSPADEKPKTEPKKEEPVKAESKAEAKKEEPKKEEPGKMEEKIIFLPATGKLSDVQGEDTEDFIEVIENPVMSSPKNDGPTADAHIRPLPRLASKFVPVQGDSIFEIIRKGLVVICSILLLVCLGVLISGNIGKKAVTSDNNSFLDNYVTKYVINEKPEGTPNGMLAEYYSLYDGNRDTVGWLSIADTPIDLVVLQGKDNDEYKNKDYYGEQLKTFGAYADYRCSLKQFGKTTILYVANPSEEAEIAGIDKYHNLEPGQTLPNIKFNTLYDNYEWKIVGCSLLDDATNVLYTAYETPLDFMSWLEKNNVYDKQVADYTKDDKLLVISIPYHDFETQNTDDSKTMILVAKLVK